MNYFRTLALAIVSALLTPYWSTAVLACDLKTLDESDVSTSSIFDAVQNKSHCIWALTEIHFFQNGEPYLRMADEGEEISTNLASFTREENPAVENFDGNTPLHLAIRFKNRAAVASFAIGKSLPCHPTLNEFINLKNKWGNTPMHLAAQLSSPQYAMILFRYGGKVDSVNAAGKTPIDLAREHGFSETQKFLENPKNKMLAFKQLLRFFVPIVRDGTKSISLNDPIPICPNSL